MSYFQGFVIAVPSANRDAFIKHAQIIDPVFVELGAVRVVECWGVDVPEGKTTDFKRAVKAKDDETIVFAFIEWPDKATHDAAVTKMNDMMAHDDRFSTEKNPMPFDGMRLIYGGFETILDLRG